MLGLENMTGVPTCEEKVRLLRAYTFAMGDYGQAVAVLNLRAGVMSKEGYDKLRALAEQGKATVDRWSGVRQNPGMGFSSAQENARG